MPGSYPQKRNHFFFCNHQFYPCELLVLAGVCTKQPEGESGHCSTVKGGSLRDDGNGQEDHAKLARNFSQRLQEVATLGEGWLLGWNNCIQVKWMVFWMKSDQYILMSIIMMIVWLLLACSLYWSKSNFSSFGGTPCFPQPGNLRIWLKNIPKRDRTKFKSIDMAIWMDH